MPSFAPASDSSRKPNKEDFSIREVWASNLHAEFKEIRQVIQQYPYVAMDTEFPGVVARPLGEFKSTADYQYQLLKCNVGLLKLIQVGFTFMNKLGEMPKNCTWQLNFKFNLTEDMYAQDSIDLLQNAGINFKRHEEEGIDVNDFAELLLVSGLVLCEDVTWLSFHSGYDFGYLLKILSNQPLPTEETEFFDLLHVYFPTIYDIKFLMKSCKSLKGGLQEVADQLQVERIGPEHQAGSDSLLTGMAFFKINQVFFEDRIDKIKYAGHLYGLGAQNGQPAYPAEDVGLIANGNAVNAAGGGDAAGTSASSSLLAKPPSSQPTPIGVTATRAFDLLPVGSPSGSLGSGPGSLLSISPPPAPIGSAILASALASGMSGAVVGGGGGSQEDNNLDDTASSTSSSTTRSSTTSGNSADGAENAPGAGAPGSGANGRDITDSPLAML